jgi:hypothetical protein
LWHLALTTDQRLQLHKSALALERRVGELLAELG